MFFHSCQRISFTLLLLLVCLEVLRIFLSSDSDLNMAPKLTIINVEFSLIVWKTAATSKLQGAKYKEREMQARKEGINQWKGPRFVGRGPMVYFKANYTLALFLNHLCRNKNAPSPYVMSCL